MYVKIGVPLALMLDAGALGQYFLVGYVLHSSLNRAKVGPFFPV